MLPDTLVPRPGLHERLTSSVGKRLTVVVGTAGAGKSVLVSSWAATRASGVTSWLSCDEADAHPGRFWTGFIEAARMTWPGFGAEAADLLVMDDAVSPDVIASIGNDVAGLPPGAAIIVDDFHAAEPAASRDMAELVQRWPVETAQLVLASRSDPAVRLHRLRLSGDLCELRDDDLHLSLDEAQDLLTRFGVDIGAPEVALLHQRSEGWAAALQMAALSLRGTSDPARVSRALDVGRHPLAEYFVTEVLERQPAEVVEFMLETSILDELTAEGCAAVTERTDAAWMLRRIDTANLFVVPLDEERASFRYHQLVSRVLRTELRTRDRAREQLLQVRAAQWYQVSGNTRRAARHLLAADQVARALTLMRDGVVTGFLRDPVLPAVPDLSSVPRSVLADAPDGLLGLAADLLTAGHTAEGGHYLDLMERAQPTLVLEDSVLAARFTALRCFRFALEGRVDEALDAGLAARRLQATTGADHEFETTVPLVLLRVHTWLEDFDAVDGEAAAVLALPSASEPVKGVLVPGAQALAWFESGRLQAAAEAATAAQTHATALGFDRHFFAVDYLRALAGIALEQRNLDTAERLTEQALSIAERRRPSFEFLALLDRAALWAGCGQVRDAVATIDAARAVLAGTTSRLLSRADELEAVLRLSLGDVGSATELANRLPPVRRDLLLARIVLCSGDHRAAQTHLQSAATRSMTPRQDLVRRVLLAAAAIERHDPMAAGIVGGVIDTARHGGFLNTVTATAPQLAGYLVEHAAHARHDLYLERLVSAAVETRSAPAVTGQSHRPLTESLTGAEMRILRLLPTSSYLQIAETLYISRNTVKTHLRSIYQKLDVTSRSRAIERAVDLRLL